MTDVAVIDYGVGNLLSVRQALEHCGARVSVSADPAAILAARRVVLPGVGAFSDTIGALRAHRLDDVVREVATRGVPLLGIRVGMQMLFDDSEEFGLTAGLGLIPGHVVQVPARSANGAPRKIPHIGWNALARPTSAPPWSGGLLDGIASGEAVYFVHSFMAEPARPADRLADCRYDGIAISAVVQRGALFGCQFHPEKSGEVGLRLLKNFLQT